MLRDYQIDAINSFKNNNYNGILQMATGTGKTRTTIAMVDALMRAGWVERVLFLVDRIALRNQALEAFKEYLPNEPAWPKIGEKSIAKELLKLNPNPVPKQFDSVFSLNIPVFSTKK